MLSLYQLQCYYINEIRRGLGGIGEYKLKPCYISLQSSDIDYIYTKSPVDIVTDIKEGFKTQQSTVDSNGVGTVESVSNVETSTAQSEEEYNDGEHSTVHTDEVTCSNNTNNEATTLYFIRSQSLSAVRIKHDLF